MPRLLNPILILLRSAKNRCADIQDIKLREAIYTDIEEAENFYYENDYEIVRHSFSYVSLLQANNINQENANKVMKLLKAKLIQRKELISKFNNYN